MKLLSEAMRWAADSSAFWEQPMCVYIIHKGTAAPWRVGFTVRDFLLSFNNLKSRNSQPCPNDLVMKRSWVHTNTAEEVPGKPCTGGICVQWMVFVCAQWMVLVHSKVQHQAEASASPGSAQSGIAWTPGSRTTKWHWSGPAWTSKLFCFPPTWPTSDLQPPRYYHPPPSQMNQILPV